ncbi:predicted protein [Naegleria gruberi]|uniref:Predicted protein n=1 Tax=Naegleria gruberi TaxID=5762 RepID=D2VDH9_NAEGR|nr:uncharacterized protein NAEGRDRAFT_66849 [Naegleria gruberi]EFC45143.1 predicted protein [Naegleria gruberi]|eukprot:XP_002677887.1 predicted protein [Naegleria gruberi strain NEG-M]
MSATTTVSSYYSSVFVAGATGVTGMHVAKALLNHQSAKQVSILVREGSEEKATELVNSGAKVVKGDVLNMSEEELTKALESVEVVVSVIQGHDDKTMFDGQLKLLNAAKKAGVKKFLPSSFGFNYNLVNYGDSLFMDTKKKFVVELEKSGLEYVQLHVGAFAHYASSPSFVMKYDKDSNTVSLSGDFDVKFGITTSQDIGKFAAEAALRRDITKHNVTVRDDYLSVREIAQLVYGSDVKLNLVQTTEELKKSINERSTALDKYSTRLDENCF